MARQMLRLADDAAFARRLGQRGYAQSDAGHVPDLAGHLVATERIHADVIACRDAARIEPGQGSWRITFDTNPDTCNLRCIVCEERSPHSPLQEARKAAGKPRRLMPIELVRRVIAQAYARRFAMVEPFYNGQARVERFDGSLEVIDEAGCTVTVLRSELAAMF